MAVGQGRWVSRQELAQAAVVFGKQNVIPWVYYDTQVIAPGNAAVTQQFFTNTLGANGVSVTNLEQANLLQSGKQMHLSGIDLDIFAIAGQVAGTLADLYAALHSKSTYTLKVNGKEMIQAPASDLVGGSFFGFGNPQVVAAPGLQITYQAPRKIVRTELDGAVLIPTATTFTFQIDWAAALNPAASLGLRINFRGQLIRLATA